MKERKYFSDYAPIDSEAGSLNPKKFKYIGNYKIFDIDEQAYKRFKLANIVFTLVIVLCFFVAGMVNAYAGKCAYVIIPYVFTIFPILYLIMGVIKLTGIKNKFTRKQFDFSIIRIYHSIVALLFLNVFVIVANFIMYLANYSDTNTNDIIFSASQLIMLVAVVLFYKQNKNSMKLTKDLSSEQSEFK